MTKERKVLLGLLAVAAGVLLVDRFILSDQATGSTATNTARASAPPGGNQANRKPSSREIRNPKSEVRNGSDLGFRASDFPAGASEVEQGYRPLPLHVLARRDGVTEQASRNVFVYYVPPPPPVKPPPPPPPPPLAIYSLEPHSVYARTKDFTLTVKGARFPEDAQIVVNGRPLKTERVSEVELRATVDKRMIATAAPLQVMVRNSTGELYSNQLTLAVQEPEPPRYRYLGRVDDLVFLLKSDNERLVARLNGQLVENRWLVTQVSAERVVLKDVTLDILHTLPIEDADASPGGQVGGVLSPNQGNINRGRNPRSNVRVTDMQPAEPVSAEDEEPR
ncbi:MAG: hypothetical protein RMM98_13955 [Acidobacteriota bacterium]|nr:hypothetical protein [Blastocatellia bacterium]MDW8240709.1 hypothetical protein [Acidobacteriota bacterium]